MSPGEAAAHWVVRKDRDDIGPREEAQFMAWLEEPANAAAFARAQSAFDLFEAHVDTDRHLQALRQAALASAPPRRYRASAMVAASLAGLGIAAGLTFGGFEGISPHGGQSVAPPTVASSEAPPARSVPSKPAQAALSGLKSTATGFVVFNIVFGLTLPNIDVAAHLGGLAAGYLCGLLLSRPFTPEGVAGRPRGRRRACPKPRGAAAGRTTARSPASFGLGKEGLKGQDDHVDPADESPAPSRPSTRTAG